MTARADTWMPLYIGDYLADTMHLNGAEHGAYVLLIMHYWRTGPLPDDDKLLAAVARTDRATWESEVGPVVRGFFQPQDGRLHHKRIDRELANAIAHTEQRRAAGRASANARARATRDERPAEGQREADESVNDPTNGSQREIDDRSTSVAAPLERNGRPSPSPSPSPSPVQKDISPPTEAHPAEAGTPASRNEVMEAFEAWNRLAADTGLPKAQKLDEGRRRAIAVRLRENAGIAGWNRALREIRGSPFLLGRERLRDGECRWNASLDWLTKPSNFRKVLDGNYAPKSRLSRGEETARAIYDALVPDAMPPPDASDPDAITLQHSEWFHEH